MHEFTPCIFVLNSISATPTEALSHLKVTKSESCLCKHFAMGR